MTAMALLACLALWAAPTPLPPVWLDNFERSSAEAGWPGWADPVGPAAPSVQLDVLANNRGRVGRLVYRRAHHHVMLPAPDRRLDGLPKALLVSVHGDGSRTLLSATLRDATGEWLHTESLPIWYHGWRHLRLDLTRIKEHAHGNNDGEMDPPIRLLSLNLTFGTQTEGELLFDDLVIEQDRVPSVAFLACDVSGPTASRIYLPTDPPPQVQVVNRGYNSIPVHINWRLGERAGEEERLVSPGQPASLPVPLKAIGPQRLEVALRTDEGERRSHCQVTLLPPRVGGPDTFLGLGDLDLSDLLAGRLVTSLGLLRAACADWTLLSLPQRRGAPSVGRIDRDAIREALTLSWAQGLRVVGYAAPSGGDQDYAEVVSRLDHDFRDDIKGWLIAPPPTGDYSAVLHRVRRSLRGPKVLLADLGDGQAASPIDGADAALVEIGPTSKVTPTRDLPRAWQLLQAEAARAGGTPVWLWSPSWPLAALTGNNDRAAALAITLACARATPNVVAAGWGALFDRAGAAGLLADNAEPRPECLAFAVSSRLTGGLSCRGIRSPAPDVYVAEFAANDRVSQVAWTEGLPADLPVPPGVRAFDVIGRLLPVAPTVKVTTSPLYLVAGLPL